MRTFLRSKVTLLFMTCAVLLAIPAIVLADNVQNDVVATAGQKIVSVQAGQTTAGQIGYQIAETGGDSTDTTGRDAQKCNPAVTPAKLTLSGLPAGVDVKDAIGGTLTAPHLTFTTCGTYQYVKFAVGSSVPAGDYIISVSDITNNGFLSGDFNETNATFTLRVSTAPPSDTTAPVIDYTLNPPTPDGSNDWYKGNVSLTWSVTDPESAVTKTGCANQNITADQAETIYSCSATSAGGSAGPVNVTIKRDGSAPNAPTATTDPANPVANSGDFFRDSVTVSYDGSTDVGPSGIASYTADETFNTTGTHNYSGKATDNAGNESAATTGSVKVDATDPTVGITGCPTSAVLLKSTQNITVAASDQANGSGLVSDPSGQVSLDTSSVGQHTKTITVDDKVGHTNSATCTYSVKYNFIGFSSPVDNPGVLNVAKAGSAIPLKWQLLDANGPVTNLSSVNLSVATLACAGLGTTDDLEVYASGSSGLQNLGGGYYQFNWKSQSSYANSCKTLTLDLGEGKDADGNTITHKALFQFKK